MSTKNNIDGTKLKTSEGFPVTVIDEAANEFVAAYLPPLFLPILFEFDTDEPIDLLNLINANPHGYLTFEYKGNQFEGYIIKATTKPVLDQVQSFTLLATPNNNLLNIVYPE